MFNINSWVDTIFQLGDEEGKINLFKEISVFLNKFIEDNLSFLPTLNNISFSKLETKTFFDETSKYIDQTFNNFLFLLIETHGVLSLKKILQTLILRINKKLGILSGIVWTTFEVENSYLQNLIQVLENKTNKKVELENKLDVSLIGGIKLQIGDNIIDSSIKNNLLNLSKDLLSV